MMAKDRVSPLMLKSTESITNTEFSTWAKSGKARQKNRQRSGIGDLHWYLKMLTLHSNCYWDFLWQPGANLPFPAFHYSGQL
jgi:hypothetical protein